MRSVFRQTVVIQIQYVCIVLPIYCSCLLEIPKIFGMTLLTERHILTIQKSRTFGFIFNILLMYQLARYGHRREYTTNDLKSWYNYKPCLFGKKLLILLLSNRKWIGDVSTNYLLIQDSLRSVIQTRSKFKNIEV